MLLRPKRLASVSVALTPPRRREQGLLFDQPFRKTEAQFDFAKAVKDVSSVLPFPRHDGPGFDLDEHVRQVDPDSPK